MKRYYGANATRPLYKIVAIGQTILGINSKFAASASGSIGLGAPNLMWALEKLGVPISWNVAFGVAVLSALLIVAAFVLGIMAALEHFRSQKSLRMIGIGLMFLGAMIFGAGLYFAIIP